MKQTFTILLVLFTTLTALGQLYEPQIIILAPNVIKYDPAFEKEITQINAKLKASIDMAKQSQMLQSPEFKKQPLNLQLITTSQVNYLSHIDFFKQISLMALNSMAYRFYEKFNNMLLLVRDEKLDGSIAAFKKLTDTENMQYVLNFPSVELYKQGNKNLGKIAVQLFDRNSGSLLLDKTYTGDARNHGFEFSCDDGSISCNINNAMSQALEDVIQTINNNSPTLIRERDLALERSKVLNKTYYPQPFNREYLNSIVSNDTTISMATVYQCLYNADKTKFAAFFLTKVSANSLKSLNHSNDGNVKILTSKQIGDKGYLDDMPQTYAYIVTGVKFKDKWYYIKTNVTYFEAKNDEEGRQYFFNNLQTFNFFKPNTTDFNPDFWETNLFEKVPDLTKDPDWPKYGQNIWKSDEEENRPYVGLYKIVADKLREGKGGPVVKRISMD